MQNRRVLDFEGRQDTSAKMMMTHGKQDGENVALQKLGGGIFPKEKIVKGSWEKKLVLCWSRFTKNLTR